MTGLALITWQQPDVTLYIQTTSVAMHKVLIWWQIYWWLWIINGARTWIIYSAIWELQNGLGLYVHPSYLTDSIPISFHTGKVWKENSDMAVTYSRFWRLVLSYEPFFVNRWWEESSDIPAVIWTVSDFALGSKHVHCLRRTSLWED